MSDRSPDWRLEDGGEPLRIALGHSGVEFLLEPCGSGFTITATGRRHGIVTLQSAVNTCEVYATDWSEVRKLGRS